MEIERKICTVWVIVIVVFLSLCQLVNGAKIGYKPVDDPLSYTDNFLYEEWCRETFDYGEYVYGGYKKIAFDIGYTPEPRRTDFWQTPIETARLKKGDCEDAVFLFFDYLAYSQDNAEIIWGWVADKQNENEIGKAHVWCQLTGRDGEEYIVEGFSGKWNGIIPVSLMERSETRIPTFKLSCSEFNRLYVSASLEWDIKIDKDIWVLEGDIAYGHMYTADEVIFKQSPDYMGVSKAKEIKSILKKLRDYFQRKEKSK